MQAERKLPSCGE